MDWGVGEKLYFTNFIFILLLWINNESYVVARVEKNLRGTVALCQFVQPPTI